MIEMFFGFDGVEVKVVVDFVKVYGVFGEDFGVCMMIDCLCVCFFNDVDFVGELCFVMKSDFVEGWIVFFYGWYVLCIEGCFFVVVYELLMV